MLHGDFPACDPVAWHGIQGRPPDCSIILLVVPHFLHFPLFPKAGVLRGDPWLSVLHPTVHPRASSAQQLLMTLTGPRAEKHSCSLSCPSGLAEQNELTC